MGFSRICATLLGRVDDPLEHGHFLSCATGKSHWDAVRQHTFNRASAEGAQQLLGQDPQEVSLLCFIDQHSGVSFPGQFII